MNNLYVIKTKSFYLGIPEGLELRDLCCYSADRYSSILVCHLDGACRFFSLSLFFIIVFFGCVRKDGNCQAGFLKLNFKTDYLFEGYVLRRHIKQGLKF